MSAEDKPPLLIVTEQGHLKKPKWRREHGKVWLDFEARGRRYEIPFDRKTRYVNGMVLFWDVEVRTLVKGMMAPDLLVNDDLEKLCPEADLEVRRFQAAKKREMGVDVDGIPEAEIDPDYPWGGRH